MARRGELWDTPFAPVGVNALARLRSGFMAGLFLVLPTSVSAEG